MSRRPGTRRERPRDPIGIVRQRQGAVPQALQRRDRDRHAANSTVKVDPFPGPHCRRAPYRREVRRDVERWRDQSLRVVVNEPERRDMPVEVFADALQNGRRGVRQTLSAPESLADRVGDGTPAFARLPFRIRPQLAEPVPRLHGARTQRRHPYRRTDRRAEEHAHDDGEPDLRLASRHLKT